MSNVATDVAPNTDHVVALVRRWLAESGAWEEVYSDSVATVWVSR